MTTDARPGADLAARLAGTRAAIDALEAQFDVVTRCAALIADRLRTGHTLYTAGNGGSAAQAMHLAEEIVGRYRSNRQAFPAVCLNADPTALTCIANDFGFDEVFARPCSALLRPDDVLVVLSTSGESANITRALEVARTRGATTVGLLGRTGGRARTLCDHAVVIPLDDSAHVQEAHLAALHLWCEALEP